MHNLKCTVSHTSLLQLYTPSLRQIATAMMPLLGRSPRPKVFCCGPHHPPPIHLLRRATSSSRSSSSSAEASCCEPTAPANQRGGGATPRARWRCFPLRGRRNSSGSSSSPPLRNAVVVAPVLGGRNPEATTTPSPPCSPHPAQVAQQQLLLPLPPSSLLREVWARELQPLVECGVLPTPLPAVEDVFPWLHMPALQQQPAGGGIISISTSSASSVAAAEAASVDTAAAALMGDGTGATAAEPPSPSSASPTSPSCFWATAIYDTVYSACVSQQQSVSGSSSCSGSPESRTDAAAAASVAALCITSVLCEHVEREQARTVRRSSSAAAATPPGGGGGGVHGSGPDEGRDKLIAFLQEMTRDEIAAMLVSVLREEPDMQPKMLKIVDEIGVDGVAEALEATEGASQSDSGDARRRDGSGQRSLGGVFFRQIKHIKARRTQGEVTAALSPLEPLRPYQRDVVGMVLASWGLKLPPELLGAGSSWLPAGVGQRADAAAFRAAGGGWAGNWLVSAPTNAGKTRMFIEVARGMLSTFRQQHGQGAVVVVLVPTVILTKQHVAYFERAGLPQTAVREVSSDAQLTADEWWSLAAEARRPAGRSQVLVCTAAAFLNVVATLAPPALPEGSGSGRTSTNAVDGGMFAWLGSSIIAAGGGSRTRAVEFPDLLILDEAHHCQGDHAYAAVVAKLRTAAAIATATAAAATGTAVAASAASPPRILAVTASPASEANEARLASKVGGLLERLGAKMHVLDEEDDPDVARVVARPEEREVSVVAREEDRWLAAQLQDFATDVAQDTAASWAPQLADGTTACWVLQQELDAAARSCRLKPQAGRGGGGGGMGSSRMQPITEWVAKARTLAGECKCPRLDLTSRLLDILCKAAELTDDVGFEGALPYLARRAASLCREELRMTTTMKTPMKTSMDSWSDGDGGGGAGDNNDEDGDGSDGGGRGHAHEPRVLSELRTLGSGGIVATPSLSAAAATAVRAAATAGDTCCEDLPVLASHWVARLLAPAGGPLSDLLLPQGGIRAGGSSSGSTNYTNEHIMPTSLCFAPGAPQQQQQQGLAAAAAPAHPKFAALVEYLAGVHTSRDSYHGIVFVRSRQALFHVADLLRRTPVLQGVEVIEVVGQSRDTAATAPDCLPGDRDRASRGMNGGQQQRALQRFKAPGRKLLLATSAAEEGMDVPSCQFVVRYNAAATGIQLRQSRGRARARDAEFVAILQAETLDVKLHAKSRAEEHSMRTLARQQYGSSAAEA